jgi:hypothetical protein
MAAITLFSAPKPFIDPHVALIQHNAIRSWTLLPDVEVLLIGAEQGVAETARNLGVKHIPEVACNSAGTPLISSMITLAREHSHTGLLCIINTDIVVMEDFVQASRQVGKLKDKFVLLSQRWDFDNNTPLEFTENWQSDLRASVLNQNTLHRPAGSDFFLFPRACYAEVPGFTIGRAGWDNWMIYKARQEKWSVIDCTPSVMIVHQNHDYSHLPGGKPHHEHPDSNENIRLAGGQAPIRYTILDATLCLVDGKLTRPKITALRFRRKVEVFLRQLFFFLPEKAQENIVRPRRWKRRLQRFFGNREP